MGVATGERRPVRPLENGDEIQNAREPSSRGALMADVSTLLPVLHDILDDVRRLTSGPIASTVENANKLIETLAPRIRALKVGPATDPDAEMGPLVTKEHMQKVLGYIDHGIK